MDYESWSGNELQRADVNNTSQYPSLHLESHIQSRVAGVIVPSQEPRLPYCIPWTNSPGPTGGPCGIPRTVQQYSLFIQSSVWPVALTNRLLSLQRSSSSTSNPSHVTFHLIPKGDTSQSPKKAHFGCLYLQSQLFSHGPPFAGKGTGKKVWLTTKNPNTALTLGGEEIVWP